MKKMDMQAAALPNGDENIATLIGNFHKTMRHNKHGEIIADDYAAFKKRCDLVAKGKAADFKDISEGEGDYIESEKFNDNDKAAKLTSPLAGAATESHGPDPKALGMPPAPGILSAGSAAEMVELYWMALLRDLPLTEFCTATSTVDLKATETDIKEAFTAALAQDKTEGALELGCDLPQTLIKEKAHLDISLQTLFRCGLPDEQYGPLISQFLLRDIPYGVQQISVKQVPYLRGKDFLTDYRSWWNAQNTGKDRYGRDYANCNNYEDQLHGREQYYPLDGAARHISTMRDLARFVNRDALHQAYFNAALFLDAIGAPLDEGNPYNKGKKLAERESGFATLGGPDLLTLVSEVASRALKVVWRQKWLVHRRCRPEAFGGAIHMQLRGLHSNGKGKKKYGINDVVTKSHALKLIRKANKNSCFLPMAFSAGSPNHPAYGAGHATVAGACITILKAWFKEDIPLYTLLPPTKQALKEPWELGGLKSSGLLSSGRHIQGEQFAEPGIYFGADAQAMTVGGELNKLASNIAMGRSMGGVHWRSDNTRSLRLGERIACEILRKRVNEYAEQGAEFSFRGFDGDMIEIKQNTEHK